MKAKKEYPLVSVVIANYNGKQYLKGCLDSLLNIKYPAEKLEVILVDNGSKDDSLPFLKKHYPSVKVLKNNINNYARANNLGIKAAKGEFVALANNDLVFDKSWLAELVKVIKAEERVGAVMGKVLFPDGKLQSSGHWDLPNFYWSDRGFREDDVGQYDKIEEMRGISHCAVLYRKACLSDVGPLDEDFNMYVEDVDMAIRVKQKGWRLLYVPRGRVYHKFHGTATEDTVRFYCERNRLLLVAKQYPHKLPEALFGKGYFTAVNNRSDLFKVLPEVLGKLIATSDAKTLSALWPSFFESLSKISNVERDHVAVQLDALKKTLLEKSELMLDLEKRFQEVDAQCRRLAQYELLEKEFKSQRELWESNLASQQALLEREKKSTKALEDALWASDAETGRLRAELEDKNKELEKRLLEIESQAGKLLSHDLLEKEFRSQKELLEKNFDSQQALLAEEKNARKDLENVLRVHEEEFGRFRSELELKNRELGIQWRELEARAGRLAQYEQWEKDLKAQLEVKNRELGDQWRELEARAGRLAQYEQLEKDLKAQLDVKNGELGDQWHELEARAGRLAQYEQLEKELKAQLEEKTQELGDQGSELEARAGRLAQYEQLEKELKAQLEEKTQELGDQWHELEARAGRLAQYEQWEKDLKAQLEVKNRELGNLSSELEEKNQESEGRRLELADQGRELEARARRLEQYEQLSWDLRAKQTSLEHMLKVGNEALEHYKAESTTKSGQIEILHQELARMTENRDVLQKEISDFYASRTFRYAVGPAWKVLDRLKQWRRAFFSFGKKPPKGKEEKKRQALFIKPQQVSIDQMEKSVWNFKAKEPDVKVSLLANLTAEDYEFVSSSRFGFIDERLLYTPKSRKFCFKTQRELLKDLRKRKLNRAIVLKGEKDYAGYRKARLFALLVGAKAVEELAVYDPVPGTSKFQVATKAWKESLQQIPRMLANLVLLAGVLSFFLVFIVGDMKIRKYLRRFQKG